MEPAEERGLIKAVFEVTIESESTPTLTLRPVLAADETPVAEVLQRVEQVAVAELAVAVGLVSAGNLSDLNVT